MRRGRSVFAWMYTVLLYLLPRDVRHADGEEMVALFEALWTEATGWAARLRLLVSSFGRFPVIAGAEWGAVLSRRFGRWEPGAMVRELRLAARSLARAPAFTTLGVLLVGLGIAGVTTVFAVVDHVLLRPLPYPEPERLVYVGDGTRRDDRESHSGPLIRAMQEIDAIDAWAIAVSQAANLTGDGVPIRVTKARVSEDFFAVFAGTPAAGRLLERDDFVAAARVVLSHGLWSAFFGSDPSIVGKTIRLETQPMTVVGVLRPDFQPPRTLVSGDVGIWQPIDWSRPNHQRIDYEDFEVVGRLAPGVSLESAQTQFDALADKMAATYPERFVQDGEVVPLPLFRLQDTTVQFVRAGLYALLAAVSLLLVIAAANVANLFLSRGLQRSHEVALRRALGAGVPALVRQVLAESVTVAGLGCALGLAASFVAVDLLLRLSPADLPLAGPVAIDLRVLAVAVAVSFATAVFFGLVPALLTLNARLERQGSRSSTNSAGTNAFRNGVVVAEVALSFLIVTQAGLLMRSFLAARGHESGIDPDRVVALQLRVPGAESGEEFVATMNGIRATLESLPAVDAAGYGINLPFEVTGGGRAGWSNRFEMFAGGAVRREVVLRQMPVSPTYFRSLGIQFLRGGPWSEREGLEPPVRGGEEDGNGILPVVFSRSAALHFFDIAEQAVGETVMYAEDPDRGWLVTGVVEDVRHWGLDQPQPLVLYLPTYTMPGTFRQSTMAVRLLGDGSVDQLSQLREAVWSVAPEVPVEIVPITVWIEASTAGRRFDAILFGLFAATGLVLAAAGVHASLLFAVRMRRREMGIRRALGATSATVHRDVMGHGVRLAVSGILIGLASSAWVSRILETRLYEVQAFDPVTLLATGITILGAAGAACWLPARWAARSDPVECLGAP